MSAALPASDAAMVALRAIALRRTTETCTGPAHDASHVERVAALADAIARAEGADREIVAAASLLHELFNHRKDHPDAARSGDLAAPLAADVLAEVGLDRISLAVVACIRDHAWSKGVVPSTLEGKVLQDADRLDAIGAVGVARCFAVAGELRRGFYDTRDPLAARRPLDDRTYTLDHFFVKLLRIPERLHTDTARALAVPRIAAMRAFLDAFSIEVEPLPPDGG